MGTLTHRTQHVRTLIGAPLWCSCFAHPALIRFVLADPLALKADSRGRVRFVVLNARAGHGLSGDISFGCAFRPIATMGLLCALVILCCSLRASDAAKIGALVATPDYIAVLQNGLLRVNRETLTFTIPPDSEKSASSGPESKIYAAYINAPAWSTYSISLSVQQPADPCVVATLKWRAFVSGVKAARPPEALRGTVGNSLSILQSWTADVTSATPETEVSI